MRVFSFYFSPPTFDSIQAFYNWAIAISDRAKMRGRTKEAEELWKLVSKNKCCLLLMVSCIFWIILDKELNSYWTWMEELFTFLVIVVKCWLIERGLSSHNLIFVKFNLFFPRQQATMKKQFNLTGTVLRFFSINS